MVTDALRKEFHFYRDNQDEMVEKYDGKVVAIKDGKVLGAYDSVGKALNETQKTHELGTFIELTAALNDLHESKAEAHEEGYPIPSDKALENAERLLKAMYRISPRRYEIYPTPDGEIAIDAPGGYNRSVLLLCDSQGGALCLVNINGNHRRARYSSSERLPDGFACEALADVIAEDAVRNGRRAGASPILDQNPYHADIVLPRIASEDREDQKRHAQELADMSRWRSRPRSQITQE